MSGLQEKEIIIVTIKAATIKYLMVIDFLQKNISLEAVVMTAFFLILFVLLLKQGPLTVFLNKRE